MKDWIAFWDSPHSIYVNARHRDAHYLRIAEDITRYVPADGYVLDYGCGEALHADMPAAIAHRLILCEAAPRVRSNLAERFAGNPKILVIGPEQVAELEDRSLDLIVMHSVAQYLTQEEFSDLLMLFRGLLKPDGLLVVGDIIPPPVSALTDALQLLRFARKEGFFFAALLGLLRTMFSRYWRLRSRFGLARYSRDEMLRKLTRAGFWVTTAERNIGHNQARVTYLGRLSPRHE
ncbi:MAG TPA: methyltransferase domain-containing protein [Xanthobacteraceae bacterium]|nr:methyltransferase domain-containing protein [Xanthobacteraceae bacterium]